MDVEKCSIATFYPNAVGYVVIFVENNDSMKEAKTEPL